MSKKTGWTRRGVVTSLGAVALSVAGAGLVNTPAQATEFQSNWRWCRNCQGLFYGGNIASSRCPAGGRHTATGSWNYIVPFVAGTGTQDGWRWCATCQGLFYALNSTSGTCPAGGGHNHRGSYEYRVAFSPATGQEGWRWCNKCQGLFYGGFSNSRCPAGGAHSQAGSGRYVLGSIE